MALTTGALACGVCGAPAPAPFRAPAAEQAPDLDLRPGEPTRSSLRRWMQVCRRCGACAPDLAALPADAPVGSDAYRAVPDAPRGTQRFRRWALLCPRPRRHEALLWAAWAADDSGADAAALRAESIAAWGEPADPRDALRRIDVLRRAGMLAEALAACAALTGVAEPESLVLAFQRSRIELGDTGRHQLSSALRPPARMPHVAHGRR